MRFWRKHHREILRAGHKVGAHLVGIIRFDVKRSVGKTAPEIRNPLPDILRGKVVLNAKAHCRGRPARHLNTPPRLVPFMAKRAGVCLKALPLHCQIRPGARPCEQPRVKRPFQRCDPR